MNRISIEGTGSQAPYGICETIKTFASTPAGLKKAMRAAAYWYNPAAVIDAEGNRVEIDWDIIRDSDRGYSLS